MKMHGISWLALLGLGSSVALAQTPTLHSSNLPSNSTSSRLAANYGKLPLSFEANQGQADPQVRFTSRGNGYSLFLTNQEAVLALSKKSEQQISESASQRLPLKPTAGLNGAPEIVKTDVVRMQLAGANPGLKVSCEEKLAGTANYFIGNDPAKWHSNVPTYGKVKYAGVYPGVDLVYYGNQRQLEYDFVVAPGADPKQVKLHFAGAKKLKLNSDGDLTVVATNGEIAFHKPVVYQQVSESARQREMVDGKFVLLAGNTVGFRLGSYDKNRELIIDPTLVYSTYLGGSASGHGGDYGEGVAADSSGNTYVTGLAGSLDFPVTQGAFQTTSDGFGDAFITKLNATGSSLVYSTYLGGGGGGIIFMQRGDGIAVDAIGNAYVTGYTYSSNFPVTKGAFQTTKKTSSYTGFVTKLNASGSSLVYSTYLGGSFQDYGGAIAVDTSGAAYVTGYTASSDFPVTAGALQINKGAPNASSNAFITKLNATGSSLVYSTYLGGSGGSNGHGDDGGGIAVDASGKAYVAGTAFSSDLPVTAGAFQTTNKAFANGGANAYITKLNATGSSLVYSTYLGGSIGDGGTSLAVDASGNAYVTGNTNSTDFPVTPGAFQTTNHGTRNAFITKLNSIGTSLVYSTYLGGSSSDSGNGIAVDTSGNAYVAGNAGSDNFPVTKDAFQTTNHAFAAGSSDAFITELDPSGSSLEYSTYLGGSSGGDSGLGITLDTSRNAYVTGYAGSTDFPVTKGAFQTVNNAAAVHASNGFITKVKFYDIDFSQGFGQDKGEIHFNNSATILDNSVLELTCARPYEHGSAYFDAPVNVTCFTTDFTFKLVEPTADGFTFTLQNAGLKALGGEGGALGYAGIPASVAIKFDLHNNAGEGQNSTGLYVGGAYPDIPAVNLDGTGINLHSEDLFAAHITYDGTTLTLRITDTVTGDSWSHCWTIDIPKAVGGSTAYAGFTGATAWDTAAQQILTWTYSGN